MTSPSRVLRVVDLPVDAGGSLADQRADIVIEGLEQGRASFELRIFLNRPDADATTEPTPESGYAGSIYIYSRGQLADPSDPTTLVARSIRSTRTLTSTEAILAAAAQGRQATVTLVPIAAENLTAIDLADVQVSIVAHP